MNTISFNKIAKTSENVKRQHRISEPKDHQKMQGANNIRAFGDKRLRAIEKRKLTVVNKAGRRNFRASRNHEDPGIHEWLVLDNT
jgi:hypothetical protein